MSSARFLAKDSLDGNLLTRLGFLAATGRTALWDAMDSALQVIHSAPQSSKVLILITDCSNNNSHLTFKELRDIAGEKRSSYLSHAALASRFLPRLRHR